MFLLQKTKKFFKDQLNDHLSYWDSLDLINLWFVLIVISDSLTILGSVFKILIDFRVGQLTTVSEIMIIIVSGGDEKDDDDCGGDDDNIIVMMMIVVVMKMLMIVVVMTIILL